MKRYWVLVAAFILASCSGNGASNIAGGLPAAGPSSFQHATTAAGCTLTPITDGSNNLYNAVGASTTDTWTEEWQGDGLAGTWLAHFVGGKRIATYTVPANASTVHYAAVSQVRILNGVPWVIGSYQTVQNGPVTNYAARFDGSKLVPYTFGSTYRVSDIGGSPSTGIYLAGMNPQNHLVIFRFNGSSFVPQATAPYNNMAVDNMVVFGQDAFVMLTVGPDGNAVAHWNGSRFSFHVLNYGPYKGNGVEITGTSPNDLWAVTGNGIWHTNGSWNPYAYQTSSTVYLEGVVEFNPKYVVVPFLTWDDTQGAVMYNGLDRFMPVNMPNHASNTSLQNISAIPGSKAFYASYEISPAGNGTYGIALGTCPASPPA